MKKLQSFEDVSNYLHKEEVPFKDNKEKILRSINAKATNPIASYKKLSLVFAASLILISSVAFAYGHIAELERFIKTHDGAVQEKLTDDKGNIVVQIGVMNPENYEERRNESIQRDSVLNRFKYIYEDLEDKISKDKIALFIPVKNLATFTGHQILNWYDHYYTMEDTKKNIPDNSPIPAYVPKGFIFDKSLVRYKYEEFYEPYKEEMTYREFLIKLFEETKKEGKDYYYKEFARLDEVLCYRLEYSNTSNEVNEDKVVPWLSLEFTKGESAVLSDNGTSKVVTEIIEHNGREYLKEESFYYTYTYIDEELWTICVNTGLSIDEISKIIESIEFQ